MNKIVICVLFLGLFGIAQSLRISGHFVENFGWQIYVGWTRTTASHVMENITITRNENEVLVVYVPATHGTTYNASIVNVDSNTNTSISCLQELSAISGICNLSVEVTGPPTDDTYTAIAYWAMNPGTLRGNSTETIIGKASPKISVIKIAGQRDNLNCTATGVPAPTFVWTLEADNTTVRIATASVV
uniref:Ig-like domain-containing protein n=1 Tax=Pectinophora gossypiella TaxID=13191 RepID=A0A1E1WHR7_PECGO